MKSKIILNSLSRVLFAIACIFAISCIPHFVEAAPSLLSNDWFNMLAGTGSSLAMFTSVRTASPPAVQAAPPQNQFMASGGQNATGRGGAGIYDYFDQFTLFADNSAGVASGVFKMQSSDSLVEPALGASLGANLFTTPDLTTIVGEDLGGADLTGLNAIRKYLATVAIWIQYVNYSGSAAAQLQNSIKAYQANPKGEQWNVSKSVVVYQSNMQFNDALIPVTQPFIFTANMALQLTVNALSTATLSFKVVDRTDYSKIL